MGEAKRKSYTAAFKAKVGLEAIRGARTINEIGQGNGVHPAQVGQWKREIQEQAEKLFERQRGPKKADGPGEPDQLYSENGRLKVDFLGPSGSQHKGQTNEPAKEQQPKHDHPAPEPIDLLETHEIITYQLTLEQCEAQHRQRD